MVNLLGHGFIGSKYSSLYSCIINEKNDLTPKCDELLYFISTVDNYNIFTNPYLDINTNLNLLIETLEHCKNNKKTIFNFASSWFVYGDVAQNANEESYCNPIGFYSITKRTAEQLLIDYCQTFNLQYRIFRFANVVGSGDLKTSSKKNILGFLIRKIVNNENIYLHDNGNFYRDYIHVEDVCNAINLLLQTKTNNVVNIGTGAPVLFRDIIDYVIKKTNSKSKILDYQQQNTNKVIQNKFFYMNIDKLNSYGFKLKYNIYTILDELIEEANLLKHKI